MNPLEIVKKKGLAQPPKGTVQPNNGIACTCDFTAKNYRGNCNASHHLGRPDRYEEFQDKNGTQIKTGDILKYQNPKFPDKEQPLHKAKWDEKKKVMFFMVEKIIGLRPARGKGRFNCERWTIISRGK